MKLKKNVSNTEVKFVLNSAVALSTKYNLANEVVEYFEVNQIGRKMKLWFLDTLNQDLYNQNWTVRFRCREDNDFELTFKKRYSDEQYYTMIKTDTAKGFSKFEPEIDMEYTQKHYSLSYVKTFPLTHDLKNLRLQDAKHLAKETSPKVLKHWNGEDQGKKLLKQSVMYGPISAVEYHGSYKDIKVTFEVWKLDDYFTEISFDIKTEKCKELHDQLLIDLQKKRLLLPKNILKTQALFDYYTKHKELLICE